MAKKLTTERTASELREELKELRKRISETERQELLGPFIEMILEAQKIGLLEPMREACIAVLGHEQADDSQTIMDADVVAEIETAETELDSDEV